MVYANHLPPNHHKLVGKTIKNGWFMKLLYPHYAAEHFQITQIAQIYQIYQPRLQVDKLQAAGTGTRILMVYSVAA